MSPLAPAAVLLALAAGPAPTDADLTAALGRLTTGRFADRERASRLLWQAGAKAEPLLRKAAASGDPEAARRAAAILEKFKWGVYPDTPADVVELITRYRSADPEGKKDVAGKLMAKGRPGYAALRRLAALEEKPEDRAAVVGQMLRDARRTVAGLLLADDPDAAAELLEACLSGDGEDALADFATFTALRGKLPEVIARFERDHAAAAAAAGPAPKPGPDDPLAPPGPPPAAARAAEALVYLHRAKGDFAAARRYATQTYKDDLPDAVLWEQGDWKALAGRPVLRLRWGTGVGLQAAYERLAGDDAAFGKSVEELRTQARAEAIDRGELRGLAEALLLNDRTADAVDALVARRKNLAMASELLAGQARFKEALALEATPAAAGDDEDAGEARDLALRRAKLLAQLGDRDGALQLFNAAAEKARQSGDAGPTRDVVKAMHRAGLKDEAAGAAAVYLARRQRGEDRQREDDRGRDVLEPLFGRKAAAAEVWWRFLRGASPAEPPGETMNRLRALLAPPRGDAARARANAGLLAKLAEAAPSLKGGQTARAWSAAAEAAAANGLDAEARGYLEKAAAAADTADAWVALGDDHTRHARPAAAAEAYARAADRDPANPLPLFLRGKAMARNGDRAGGERLVALSHWLPLGSEHARAQFLEELTRRGHAEDARKEIDLVVRLGWYRHWSVGNVLNQAARDATARKDYDRAAAYYEKSLVGCLRSGASFVDATAYLSVPHAVHLLRARARLAEGKADAALAEARACLAIMPGGVDAAIQLVPGLEKLGRKADADELFAKVLAPYEAAARDHPASAFAHNSAAWLQAGCRRRLDDALAHAKKAVSLSPASAGYLDTLAEVHFRRGEREQALEAMRKCRELEPANGYFRRQTERFAKGDPAGPAPDEDDGDEE